MAQVLNRFEDSYQPAADEEQNNDSYQPYARLLAKFGTDASTKAYENNKKTSYKAEIEEESPKLHEPPAKPLPADNLKSCMKKKKGVGKKGNKSSWKRTVSWAPSVYDPTACGDESCLSHSIELPESDNKNNTTGGGKDIQALEDVSNKGQSSKGNTYNNKKKGHKEKDNDKAGKNKDKKKQVEAEETSIKGGKGVDKKKGKERGGKHNNKHN